ncbi:trypsin-like peptidase domain-containing protein [Laspinema sp. A4]|uniref:WD40 domain-containing protein n=1 Tax=Laspinema sp. D2d TaxID=2953686 RepID=UPI0021BA6FD1|nr:trypsin-like peptidase domain-containing protein [Laspinema sp. D2d]MCT7986431.1 trypsin-like peptidase domain-containing protein [Laspinema sp. D2d]
MKWSRAGLSAAILGVGAVILVAKAPISLPQTQGIEEQAIAAMGREVSVVINGQNPGSGVIIGRNGNTYTVLTAKHAIATPDEYAILTTDAQSYPVDYRTVKKLPGVDLAVVEFTSSNRYRVAHFGNSDDAMEGATIYVSGWPHPGRVITERIYQVAKGTISGRPLTALEDGYGLIYTNITRSGMSGGPVFDNQGRLIGIHGRAEGEPIYNPDTGDTVDVKSGFNVGIPINTFVSLASETGINLPRLGDNFTPASVTLPAHSAFVLAVALAPDNQTIASGSKDGIIKLSNGTTGEEIRTLTGHPKAVTALTFSPDGQTLVSGGEDGTVKLWNRETGELVKSFQGDRSFVRAVAFSPDGTLLASGSAEEMDIKLWNPQTGELVRTLTGHRDYVNGLAFSPDGKVLVSGSTDKTIKLWNPEAGEALQTLTGNANRITSVATSPYGNLLASASADDGLVKVWNLRTGELLQTLTGHTGTVYSIAIDPYGHILASAGSDGTIQIWNLYTGNRVRNLEVRNSGSGPLSPVFSLAFSRDGQSLVSSAQNGTVQLWQLPQP